MPIQEQNIKFLESQVMDDVPEGGGAATRHEIQDGVMNNVFDDISDLDRAIGRFNLRKIFLAVRSLDTDLFGGAKTVVTALPDDDAIGYTLFTTNNAFDTRVEAANRVEAYLFKGPMWAGALYENHITGMRQIRVIQREGSELPPHGKTLCLVQREGQPDEREQYIRVTKVSSQVQTFTDEQGDYTRLIVTIDISDALRHDFTGHTPSRQDNYSYVERARLRDTSVADATRYFGSQRLAEERAIGDTTVRAQSMFTQLVPSAQNEEPLANQPLNPDVVQTINAGARTVQVAQQTHTLARPVTVENRRYNWIETLQPIPAHGTLSVSYMAQGVWYRLRDDGAGIISGSDPGFGSGTIDYSNGSMSVTLGALPDAGSQIIISSGTRVHYEVRSGATAQNPAHVSIPFATLHSPVVPGSVTLGWTAGGVAQTATINSSGVISGDGTGTLDANNGTGQINVTTLPDRGAPLTINYQWYESDDPGQTVVVTESHPNTSTITLSSAPKAGTLSLKVPVIALHGLSVDIAAAEVGGSIVVKPQTATATSGGATATYKVTAEQTIGSISSNTITITASDIAVSFSYWDGSYWAQTSSNLLLNVAGDASATFQSVAGASTATSETESAGLDALLLELAPNNTDAVVPDSLRFELGGKVYDDMNGYIATDIDPVDGSHLVAGSINYAQRTATVTFWEDGASPGYAITSLLTIYGQWAATDGYMRTASAPIKPESLQIIATTEDGGQINAIADQDGNFTHEYCQGEANYTIGTATVRFGKLVLDSSLTAAEKLEPWYDPADVDIDGFIYKPRRVIPSTLRYNAVAFSYLPLDASIVGIDAVRLPPDGRVPIYRPGDVAMIMHPQETAPATYVNTDTIATRPRVGWVRLIDALGNAITDGYSLDRATGVVTIDDASGMVMPITVRHTIADLRLITDVQITGHIQLARPLSHNYPAAEAIIASCLIHGDRRARVSAVWDQATWDGVTWSDTIVGNESTASLNTIAHPITVTNEGAETERWTLRFITAINVELIGQRVGLVYTGPFTEDIAPINPRTRDENGAGGVPYLTIPVAANGGGWNTGNVVRINTVGALADFWIARAIQQSDEPLDDGADGCEIHALGNIDRP